MKIPQITLLFLILKTSICIGQIQSEPEKIKVEEFNWSIQIPEGFQAIKKEEWNKNIELGQNAIEETFGQEIENQAVTIFSYQKGRFNNLEANWQPFDPEIDGKYDETYSAVNQILFETYNNQMPGAKLDSVSSIQKISGLEFKTFEIRILFPNGIIMKTIGFSRLFNKKEFTVNLIYVDEKIGEEMLKSFKNSEFN